jgi:hypothetical protein
LSQPPPEITHIGTSALTAISVNASESSIPAQHELEVHPATVPTAAAPQPPRTTMILFFDYLINYRGVHQSCDLVE